MEALHSFVAGVVEILTSLAPQNINVRRHLVVSHHILIRVVSDNSAQHLTDLVVVNGESSHGLVGWFWLIVAWIGGCCEPPVGSDGAVPILCPLAEAAGGCLGKHPVVLGDAAIGVADGVATGSLGALLEGVAPPAVGLGEVEQQRRPETTDHTGALNQQGGEALGVTDESLEAGGGDDGKHRSRGRGVVEVCPPRLCISYSIWCPDLGLKP